jgi:CubicO group peptidase (beta-lactamase class C family)
MKPPPLVHAVLALALVGAPHAAAQPAAPAAPSYADSPRVPDTPAYRRAREVLALVNQGDAGRIAAYVQEDFAPSFRDSTPRDEHVGVFLDAHEWSGRLVQHSARSYTPPRPDSEAVLIVHNELLDAWQGVVVAVESRPPHRITALRFGPARAPTDVPRPPRLGDAEVARRAGALVDRLAKDDLFSGTFLLAKDGKVLVTRAVGVANRDFDAPVRLDTKFNLGSMNKMFTGVAVAQLVEQGRLSLDDPIGKWLSSDWLPRDILDRVRVIHLLTHTSGLGSYFNETFSKSSRDLFRRVEDYKPLVRGETLAFEPGTRWRYSNTGMLLAGAIVEKASGQDYFDYVREHIYRPAGMTSTDCYELDKVNKNLAVGYDRRGTGAGAQYENNLFKHVLRGGPAGGGYSTVEDLLRFDQALRSGKLVRRETLERLWRAYPEVGSEEYGLGFGVERTPAGKVVGHSGGFAGISAVLSIFVDSGYTLAVLSNYGGAASQVADRARDYLLQGR